MEKISSIEDDVNGLKTLRVIQGAGNFNRWIYQTIKPFCSGEILEIGSGIGNMSQFFLEEGYLITLSDINNTYCEELRDHFSSFSNLRGIIHLDIACNNFEKEYKDYFCEYDTIFSLNVIEHIRDDHLVISNCHNLLKPNGILVVLVPAYPKLYNKFDTALKHHRRYTKKSLNKLITENNFKIMKSKYFNAIGILGWYISGKLQEHQTIPSHQMNLYDKLVFIFKVMDRILLNKIGLSVIAVAQK